MLSLIFVYIGYRGLRVVLFDIIVKKVYRGVKKGILVCFKGGKGGYNSGEFLKLIVMCGFYGVYINLNIWKTFLS